MPAKLETIQTRTIRRELTLTREAINDDARTATLCFSTEAPIYDPYLDAVVILDHSPGACDLTRMNGGPLLVQHNRNDQVGAAESPEIKDRKGYAVARFSRSARGEEIFTDVKDLIRRQVSVDAVLNKLVLESNVGGVKTLRAISWTPVEISIVSVAADAACYIARDDKNDLHKTQFESPTNTIMNPEEIAAAALAVRTNLETVRSETVTAERSRNEKILDACAAVTKLHPHGAQKFNEISRSAIKSNQTVDEAQLAMLVAAGALSKVEATDPNIGMTDKETKRFSLMRAVRTMAMTGRLDGLEKEACETAQKHLKRELKDARAFVIPEEVANFGRNRINLARAQSAGVFNQGGALVQEQYGPMIEFLRNQTVLGRAGVTILSGLVGDFIMPVQLTGSTAYWVSETGALTDTAATFGQKAMLPHRLGATIPFTTQFLAQASVSAEDLFRNELMTAMALKKDLAGLHGTGISGEPLGVQNTTGINATVTFSDAAAWADVVEFETGINVDNADIGAMNFILSAATVGKWKTIPKVATYGNVFLIENNQANGYPVLRTNQVAGNIAFFGVWNQLLHGSWAGVEVIVDPYALKKSGQIEITMNELCDYLVRQPLAFNVSTDSAAQ